MTTLDSFIMQEGTYSWGSPYGPRGGGFHGGWDLPTATGNPLLTPKFCLVNQAWDPGGGGWWTNLWFENGDLFCMGHADFYADPDGPGPATSFNGYEVPAGTVIGYAGSTGHSSGPHVHVAYRPAGARSYVDPGPLLRECEAAGRFPGNPGIPDTPYEEDDMTPQEWADWLCQKPNATPDDVVSLQADKNWAAISGELRAQAKDRGETGGWNKPDRLALDDMPSDMEALKLAVGTVQKIKG